MLSAELIPAKNGIRKRSIENGNFEPDPSRKRKFCFTFDDINSKLAEQSSACEDDDFCFWCDAKRYQDSFKCPYHDNKQIEKEQPVKSYAYKDVPDILKLYTDDNGRTRVKTVKHLPAGAWIGPYEGTLLDKQEAPLKNDFMWEIFKDGRLHGYIDGTDVHTSSWMRFIRRASRQEEQNLSAFQYKDKIFYSANTTILPGQELVVWYDQEYIQYAFSNNASPKVPSNFLPRAETRKEPFSKTLIQTAFREIAALSTTKPVPRISTGFSLNITEIKRSGSTENNSLSPPYSPPVHSPVQSPTSPNSSDSGLSFGSADSPTKGDATDTWSCGQCNTSFAQRAMLQVHVCANAPFKPFKCGHCDKSFTSAGDMRAHAVIHQGKKPFKCGYCGRSFTGATTLNNHIRIHTGEKPFKCEKCGKTFSQGSQLSKHEKIPGDCIPRK